MSSQVNVIRGKDGFGFTICSDCPVRVQAVDSGEMHLRTEHSHCDVTVNTPGQTGRDDTYLSLLNLISPFITNIFCGLDGNCSWALICHLIG